MSQKPSLFGIASIILSIFFYIFLLIMQTTNSLDTVFWQNIIVAFPVIFCFLPAMIIGFTIIAIKQKGSHSLFTYLAVVINLPTFLIAGSGTIIMIVYILAAIFEQATLLPID